MSETDLVERLNGVSHDQCRQIPFEVIQTCREGAEEIISLRDDAAAWKADAATEFLKRQAAEAEAGHLRLEVERLSGVSRSQPSAALLHAHEALATACDWFGAREAGMTPECPEAALFARISQASDYLESDLGLAISPGKTQ